MGEAVAIGVAACLLLLLVLAALIGAPLAATLTGHSPIAQYPDALHSDGLPIGFFSRTLNATGTATNPPANPRCAPSERKAVRSTCVAL